MQTTTTIAKQIHTGDDLDFEFLKKTGIEYIEKLGSDLWTDYNAHDPGVTILEMLAYAITDLSQRINMPIQDLVATEENNLKNMHEQFLSAIHILPSKPITALDYRKLFLYIPGVKNAWIAARETQVFVNCDEHPASLSYTPFEETEITHDPFILKGLNTILLDLEDEVEEPDQVINTVKKIYHQNRNLCEDLVEVSVIETHPIAICAYIDLHPTADEEYVLALIYQAIDAYFSPTVDFYSLKQMLDKGYTTDQIFEGPTPLPEKENTPVKGGFIDSKELAAADLRREVRLSDIVQLIMKIEGVHIIKDISISNCDGSTGENQWNICITPWHKPIRCDKSTFNFTKGILPIGVNEEKVAHYQEQLQEEERAKKQEHSIEDIPFPKGTYSAPDSYTTFQNDFPDTYGISTIGLPGKATVTREAKANQLKAYLLFFDQVLANYFKHLSKAKALLSIDDTLKAMYLDAAIFSEEEKVAAKQMYFSQPVTDLADRDSILQTPATYEQELIAIMGDVKGVGTGEEVFYKKRNELLDHLLSRFAERFSEYTFLMKMLYGDNTVSNDEILSAKLHFLQDYEVLSRERGVGSNYCCPEVSTTDTGIWDTVNVSGVQKRIARLLGIKNYRRRDLTTAFLEVYEEKDTDNLKEYRWRIKNDTGVLLSSSKHYHHLNQAYEELFLAYYLAQQQENFEFKKTAGGDKTYFNLINPEVTDSTDEDRIVARRIAFTETEEASIEARDALIELIKEISVDEGMYMIEHILLRPDRYHLDQFETEEPLAPDAPATLFMPVCIDADCTACSPIDPYSYRVTILFPGWTRRFRNKDFRQFAEQLIREELPAHVMAKICWIGQPAKLVADEANDMLNIQERYKAFLEAISCTNTITAKKDIENYRSTLNDLITQINTVHTIYQSGRLHDCDNEETETKGNKIILGRTNIGNL
ncbi:hypothetical protein HN014_21130 [Aquimarina sp. TRL1]|uniref:hypothetical protein n=1 Tax=Aquimarina sp. (strain TRL1) TaxID=2736252 RepID=UPI00158F478C|nr:hypothetical protein [Aquimarina sp. TRL1]QKX07307.1 hypothetical protein HN014_21130 [Aquimarina sp. TRL1]